MIITLDGPSGVGKSSLAKSLAERLGFKILYSGLIYRKLAQIISRDSLDPSQLNKEIIELMVLSNQKELLKAGRGEVDRAELALFSDLASRISAIGFVRDYLLPLQRMCYQDSDFIAEGRDMGSIVFPNADIKFYVDCCLTTKVYRRFMTSLENSSKMPPDSITYPLKIAIRFIERDIRDIHRAVAPTIKPENSIFILNEGDFTITLNKLEEIVKLKGGERV